MSIGDYYKSQISSLPAFLALSKKLASSSANWVLISFSWSSKRINLTFHLCMNLKGDSLVEAVIRWTVTATKVSGPPLANLLNVKGKFLNLCCHSGRGKCCRILQCVLVEEEDVNESLRCELNRLRRELGTRWLNWPEAWDRGGTDENFSRED